jgi:DNA-binding CsgD family transcriptional regulator
MTAAQWAVADVAAAGLSFDSGLARFEGLMERVRVRINAKLGSAGLVSDALPGKAMRFEPLAAVGEWGGEQIKQYGEYMQRDGVLSDPAYARVVTMVPGMVTGTVWLRRDLVADEEWYPTAYVRDRRKPAGIDDQMFVCCPLPTPGRLVAGTFHRAIDHGAFGERDRLYVSLLLHACPPLVATIERDREALSLLQQLPPRLRLALACLQLGDSAKEAAARLGLTSHTFREYTKALYASFKVRSRGELLARCQEMRLRAELKDDTWLKKVPEIDPTKAALPQKVKKPVATKSSRPRRPGGRAR